jgi:O-methyltransferase
LPLAYKLYKDLLLLLSLPLTLAEYFRQDTGKEYGVGLFTKARLVLAMRRNERKIIGASSFVEHLIMATHILRTPKSQKGCVVECGCYKGRSTASLSLVTALCNRELEVFDSFQGLPEPSATDSVHRRLNFPELAKYAQGAFCGSLDEVQENVRRFGNFGVCRFHEGYFDATVPNFKRRCVFVFVDADLRSSVETVVEYLWPQLQDDCSFFTHEAEQAEIAGLFFDDRWWNGHLGCDAPGLVGAGNGLGLMPARGGFSSPIGYTQKIPDRAALPVNIQTGILHKRQLSADGKQRPA